MPCPVLAWPPAVPLSAHSGKLGEAAERARRERGHWQTRGPVDFQLSCLGVGELNSDARSQRNESLPSRCTLRTASSGTTPPAWALPSFCHLGRCDAQPSTAIAHQKASEEDTCTHGTLQQKKTKLQMFGPIKPLIVLYRHLRGSPTVGAKAFDDTRSPVACSSAPCAVPALALCPSSVQPQLFSYADNAISDGDCIASPSLKTSKHLLLNNLPPLPTVP